MAWWADAPMTEERPPGYWWGLAKGVLICGTAGGLVGGAIGAALLADAYALPAAMIGGLPAGAVGAAGLGWYGMLFGAMNRIRHGRLVGAGLGLLGAGTLGVVAGLSVWALPWSLAGAIGGGVIQASLNRPERRPFGLVPGVMAGGLVGIFVRAARTESVNVRAGTYRGAMIGAVLGILLIPALLAWLNELPSLWRRPGRRK